MNGNALGHPVLVQADTTTKAQAAAVSTVALPVIINGSTPDLRAQGGIGSNHLAAAHRGQLAFIAGTLVTTNRSARMSKAQVVVKPVATSMRVTWFPQDETNHSHQQVPKAWPHQVEKIVPTLISGHQMN